MTEVWTRWEGRVINGVYPLRRFLDASDHSAVFLTETSTEGFLNAAIKIVPADPASIEAQLWHWKTATTFHHPHLIQLLDSGQCEVEGRQYLFVVMEYAEENLAQILPYRALTPGEVRELLVPALDALAFLHNESWTQGQIKPSNVLVVDDHLKLATDTIRSIGLSRGAPPHSSIYNSPESEAGQVSTSGDIWGLGVTLVEALTQHSPNWPEGKNGPPSFPAPVPVEFFDTIQRCLSADPGKRPTVAELRALSGAATSAASGSAAATRTAAVPAASRDQSPALATAAPIPGSSGGGASAAAGAISALAPAMTPATTSATTAARPEAVMRATPRTYSRAVDERNRSSALPIIAVILVVLGAIWGIWRWQHGRTAGQTAAVHEPAVGSMVPGSPSGPPATENRPEATPSTQIPPAAEPSAAASAGASPPAKSVPAPTPPAAPPSASLPPAVAPQDGVVHEEIPKVSLSSRNTIRGHIKVYVRVTVDRSGNVVRDTFEHASSSNYFNRLSSQAARKWKFVAADSANPREWVLRFEYGRDGTTAHAARTRS